MVNDNNRVDRGSPKQHTWKVFLGKVVTQYGGRKLFTDRSGNDAMCFLSETFAINKRSSQISFKIYLRSVAEKKILFPLIGIYNGYDQEDYSSK